MTRGEVGPHPDRTGAAATPELVAAVRDRLAATGQDPDPPGVARAVRDVGGVLGREELGRVVRAVRDELLGAGPLQPLLEAPDVTDVLVEGGRVWVDRGCGLERVPVDVGGPERVRALAVRLAAAGGQRLDDAAPVVDARLPDGTRLHAVLPPVAEPGTLLSLRVHRPGGYSLGDLVRLGAVAPVVEQVLRALVARRANLVVSGATGTGKTTLLAALLSLVPGDERIVCIEEAAELRPDHPHVVRLVARRPNVEGAGEIDLAALVRHALRMRPDRVVLGECRGADVREVLSALNTGHDGGCVTLHANAVADVPARLEALGALAGMTPRAVAAQAASALDAVVHLRRTAGIRHVAEVAAVSGGADGLVVDRVLACGPRGELEVGAAWPVVARRWGLDPVVT
ncbi:TadA family conjugal transfer-associated ATPase [Actinotalea sp. Marseille-Q4924]|uniref:TadA family conjugal transfer-associated ATPase n=1 Tax=Actinotalea sp. Marseille-Q4924 TaxID=2866571 RepID=UPI001CE3B607|nr:TadA family conjugal transfer-associated ATPase [Actinotalea sp. Marseille-Q4924]